MDNNSNNQYTEIPWWAIVLGFIFMPPVGLILLFLNLGGVRIPMGKIKQSFDSSAWNSGITYRHNAARAGQGTQGTGQGAAQGAARDAAQGAAQGTAQGAVQGAAQGAGRGYSYSYTYGKTGGQPQQAQRQARPQQKQTVLGRLFKPPKDGKAMTIVGGIMSAVFGLGFADEFIDGLRYGLLFYADEWVPLLGFLCAGLFLLFKGIATTRRGRRARLYQGLIGQRSSIFLSDLAAAAGVSEKKVTADLQRLLADGTLPTGFVDKASGRLVLTDQGFQPPEAEAERESKKAPEGAKEDPDDAILRQIREINDAIPDEMMTQKIHRIEEITGKILDYQKRNPAKAGELRQFLNYYLPTTLKILNAYAQMDAQGVEGENIAAAKRRIEGMMDKVVEGFEKQLDQLFQTDAMDIATDVEVLERMLDKDGLGSGMTMGG